MGEGYTGFASVLSGHYPAGRVAVLCQDFAEGQALSAALLKTHKVSLFSVTEKERKKEDVRFVIGIGSPDVVSPTIAFAEDVPFAFYAKTVDFRYLNAFDGTGKLSEFSYFDKFSSPADYLPACYSTLFSLWAEANLRLLEQSCFPFCDKVLSGMIGSAENILLGKCDKEEFLPECLRLISVFCNALSAYGELYVQKASVCGNDPAARFVSSYLLVNLIKVFTKVPRGVILNPSEEQKNRYIYDSSVLPDKEKMRLLIKRMKAMTELPVVSAEEFISLLAIADTPDTPLFSALFEKGFLKGWNHERSTVDRGVFI